MATDAPRRIIKWTVVGVVVAVIVGGLYAIFRADTDSTASNPGDYHRRTVSPPTAMPDITGSTD